MEEKREERAYREKKKELRIDTLSTAWNIERRGPNTRRGEENGGTDKDKYNHFACVCVCVFGRVCCSEDRGRWERRREWWQEYEGLLLVAGDQFSHTDTHSGTHWRLFEFRLLPCVGELQQNLVVLKISHCRIRFITTCTTPTHNAYTNTHSCSHASPSSTTTTPPPPPSPSFDLTFHWSSLLPCQIFRLRLAGLTKITMEKWFYLFNFHIIRSQRQSLCEAVIQIKKN